MNTAVPASGNLIEVMDAALNERERLVIESRFGIYGDRLTLRELGVRFGVSRNRIREIEARALRKMRDRLKKLAALEIAEALP
jgi:RNA polymerase primary sigma factor